ncbi:glycosyltransferase family 2 protein [Parabacteroides sp.]
MNAAIRISVYIVSYNQEKYIRQAIESVLNQSILPFELCIFDDHSTDKTWSIIQEFAERYPSIIKAHRHERNQGIFKNFNYAENHLQGNVITAVAGDDYIMPGYFEEVINCIERNSLNPDTDSFIIIPNIINLIGGIETRYDNTRFKNGNILSLRIRGVIDDRYGVVSRALFDKTAPYIEDIGVHADFVWGVDRYLQTEKVLFLGGYYPVYRMGVGIVSRTKEVDFAKSMIKAVDIIIGRYEKDLKVKDLRFLKYLQVKSNYQVNKSVRTYFCLCWNTFLNIGNLGSLKKHLKSFLFLLLPYKLKVFLVKWKFFESLSK